MFEEAASERKTLETAETPDGQTPEECRGAPGLCPHNPLIPTGMPRALGGSGVKVGKLP